MDDAAQQEFDAKEVIDGAVSDCIAQDGVHVVTITGLGTLISDRELNEDQRMMLAEYAEALRVKRAGGGAT